MSVRKVILAYALATVLLSSAGVASAQYGTTSSDGTTSDPYQDPCQEPPMDFWNWSYADQRQWVIDNCSDYCPPPPEGESYWSQSDWETWYNDNCKVYHTYDDPYYNDANSTQPYHCPTPEESGYDTSNWTQQDYDQYWYDCNSQHDPCYPPPESHDWTRYEWEMWYQSCDPYHAESCPLPPEAEHWSDEQWYEWEYNCWGKNDPCFAPYESHNWTRYEWEMWYESCDPYYKSSCPVPPEAENWSDDEWYRHDYNCYGQYDPCYPPPESHNWTQAERDNWYKSCDPDGYHQPTHSDPCQPPPESQYWNSDEWETFYRNCRMQPGDGPTNCPAPPADSHNWTNAERDRWHYENCDHPPCDPLPQDFWSWSDQARHTWFSEHCGPDATTQDGIDDVAADNDGAQEDGNAADNSTAGDEQDDVSERVEDALNKTPLTDDQKNAVKNQSEQIVVPGASPLLLIAGLGLVGVALRRRF